MQKSFLKGLTSLFMIRLSLIHISEPTRQASDILKDRMNVLNIFVCADKEDRIHRIMEKDNLSYDDAKEKVERTDEERASYYYEHTGKTWGDVNDYHMIMDTSELGVENCADILMHYFEKLEYI